MTPIAFYLILCKTNYYLRVSLREDYPRPIGQESIANFVVYFFLTLSPTKPVPRVTLTQLLNTFYGYLVVDIKRSLV